MNIYVCWLEWIYEERYYWTLCEYGSSNYNELWVRSHVRGQQKPTKIIYHLPSLNFKKLELFIQKKFIRPVLLPWLFFISHCSPFSCLLTFCSISYFSNIFMNTLHFDSVFVTALSRLDTFENNRALNSNVVLVPDSSMIVHTHDSTKSWTQNR